MTAAGYAIETFELRKIFNGTKVAVEGLTLQVKRGEVFGFLGPNGAGKTTSIKMILGLVQPTSGGGQLLGMPIGDPQARKRVGFLPEHFRFHEWMRADEFLDLHGQLYGISRADRRARIPKLIERVGLTESSTKRLKTFSKGMLQRIGLAMAMLPRPEVVFLDEPTSGLDPFGRRLVRDVIREACDEGTTVFLNSHLLSEVEVTCDRVAFIRHGRVIKAGTMDDLSGGLVRVEMRLDPVSDELIEGLSRWGGNITRMNKRIISMTLTDEESLPEVNTWLVGQGVRVYALSPQHLTLEELFVNIMQDQPESAVGEVQ
ncbi:MAG: ABC transporter ATP-binding protein [Anaerolineae bacterium]|nr:ABC transporter ATP-binding protein [Anaerolineae bacterium]